MVLRFRFRFHSHSFVGPRRSNASIGLCRSRWLAGLRRYVAVRVCVCRARDPPHSVPLALAPFRSRSKLLRSALPPHRSGQLLNQHKKNQDRVKTAARTKVAASQKVMDAVFKTDTANDLLLKAARSRLREAEAGQVKANITKVKSAAMLLGATQDLDTVKKEATQEVAEATKSNEEQVNEALEILGNELKLVETVRFMLANLNKQKKMPGKKTTAGEMEKELMSKAIDLAHEQAVVGGKSNGHIKPLAN